VGRSRPPHIRRRQSRDCLRPTSDELTTEGTVLPIKTHSRSCLHRQTSRPLPTVALCSPRRALLSEYALNSAERLRGTAQRRPFSRAKMLRQKNDLADVISVVRQLPIDRLTIVCSWPRIVIRSGKIFRLQRLERAEEARPAAFPKSRTVSLVICGLNHKFHVTVAVCFFAIAGSEIRPARKHVPAVCFMITAMLFDSSSSVTKYSSSLS